MPERTYYKLEHNDHSPSSYPAIDNNVTILKCIYNMYVY